MNAAVRQALPAFLEPFEGRVSAMYLDTRGLVTTGVGCLIDPESLAVTLPWRHGASGPLASQSDISRAWRLLKARQALKDHHWKHAAALNDLRLAPADVDALLYRRLDAIYAWLRDKHFAAIDCFPPDAILGILSIAWACGADFPLTFPKFSAAVRAGDWARAADECAYRNGARNAVNRACFERAGRLQWQTSAR